MNLNPIAYTYEADYHCVRCTQNRFGAGLLARCADDRADYPTDNDGNEIHPVFVYHNGPWHETDCATCGEEIEPITELVREQDAQAWSRAQFRYAHPYADADPDSLPGHVFENAYDLFVWNRRDEEYDDEGAFIDALDAALTAHGIEVLSASRAEEAALYDGNLLDRITA